MRKLPINVDFENTNTPLINLLQSIKKEGVYLRTSVEHEVPTGENILMLKVPTLFILLSGELFHLKDNLQFSSSTIIKTINGHVSRFHKSYI